MSRPAFGGAIAARFASEVRPSSRREIGERERREAVEAKLAVVQKDYADLHAALFEAAHVHRRLCAPRLVRQGEFEVASEIFAARHLPGDFFAVDETCGGVTLALGDICGKGLAAGMWASLLLGLIGTRSHGTAEAWEIVAAVNRDLCGLSLGAPLASLFLARLDSTTGNLEYCCAGHPPALLLRANGTIVPLSEGGLLLGVVADASFASGRVRLGVGDVLLVYSDGILEANNEADEEFGFERLETQLRRVRRGSAAREVLFSILGAVQDFAGACRQADDMSLVVLRRRDA